MKKTFWQKYVGDRAFYKMILAVAVPIIVQNGITNFVSLLDNIMVGQVGTEQMSGVAIANQLIFVFNLCIFGGLSGAGIFTAQFHGKGDEEGIRYTMRFKMILAAIATVLALGVLFFFRTPLISLFLHEGSATGDLALTLSAGEEYLLIMLIGLVPFSLAQVYTSTLRETGETMLPMKAGLVAVAVNFVLNYLLIFGSFGAPKLGAVGAAIATVVSRFVECAIVVVWTHRHHEKAPYMKGVWHSLHIPKPLTGDIIRRGMPLLVNETLWSLGLTMVTQCYSTRGLAVVAAININSTIFNLFNVIYMALGNAVGIVVGKLLGRGKRREAIDTDRKMIAFGVGLCVVIGGVMAATSSLFPRLYNTTEEVRSLAAYFILLGGILMPMYSFLHSCYFTLRSGGKTIVTFLFDSVFMLCVNYPLAYSLAHLTALPIREVYLICQLVDIVKCVIGGVLVKKGVWVHNIVGGAFEDDEA